jgi:hypothetical protein|tara:strand:+ start:683 stop:1006 length:324 start_codon:yes stop_codon:yes gene_type:complete
VVLFAVGNVTWKVTPEVDLSLPKSSTATAGVVPPVWYIKAPLAVIVELAQVALLKLKYAVVPEVVGAVEIVSATPPAVYPVPDTSLLVVYTVVVASRLALFVYKATL